MTPTGARRFRTGKEATKAALLEMLTTRGAPAILLTAAHSLIVPGGAPQRAEHGAIVCGDWAGPGTPLTPQFVCAGRDVTAGHEYSRPGGDAVGVEHGRRARCRRCRGDRHGLRDPAGAAAARQRTPASALAVVGLADRMPGSSLGHSDPTRQALTLAIRGLARGRPGWDMPCSQLDEAQAALVERMERARRAGQVRRPRSDPLRVGHLWSATVDLRAGRRPRRSCGATASSRLSCGDGTSQ